MATFLSVVGLLLLVLVQLCSVASAYTQEGRGIFHIVPSADVQTSVGPEELQAWSTFRIELTLPGQGSRIRLILQPSRVVTPATDFRHFTTSETSGSPQSSLGRPIFLYKGNVSFSDGGTGSWRGAGWARIMVRSRVGSRLFEGAFTLDGEHYDVSQTFNCREGEYSGDSLLPVSTSPCVVIRSTPGIDQRGGKSSISERSEPDGPRCSTGPFLSDQDGGLGNPSYLRTSQDRRQDWRGSFEPTDQIGSTAGCPRTRLTALIGVAADCSYTAEFDSLEDARAHIVSKVNIVSQVYEDAFNISLSLGNLTISDPSCPSTPSDSTPWNMACSDDVDTSARLSLFSEWRRELQDDNAVWSLLTACQPGSTVGEAWTGSLCRQGSRMSSRQYDDGDFVTSTNVVVRTRSEWQVLAHEIGHNFGASHDCTSDTCSTLYGAQDCCPLSDSSCDADGQYIMDPTTHQDAREFSPCSIGTICSAIGRGSIDTSCLINEDESSGIGSQCGNGIVEGDEECDCGNEEQCATNSCCDPSTCRLRPSAACDPAIDGCCTEECQVAESGLLCREAQGSCAEATCDGESSSCPRPDDSELCVLAGLNGSSISRGGPTSRAVALAVSASVGCLAFVILS